jgi:hypothetical protein
MRTPERERETSVQSTRVLALVWAVAGSPLSHLSQNARVLSEGAALHFSVVIDSLDAINGRAARAYTDACLLSFVSNRSGWHGTMCELLIESHALPP